MESKITTLGLVVVLTPLAAAASEAPRPWKAEDVVLAETAGDFRVSPDGMWAVWARTTADKEKDSKPRNLVLSSLSEKKEVALTRGTDNNSHPRWSPKGDRIAFLSNRPLPKPKEGNPTQVWLLEAAGGEPAPLTESERSVRAFQWVDDATLVMSAEEDPSLYEQEAKRKKDDSTVVDDATHTPPVRLFRVSVKEKKLIRLTDNDDWIQTWAVSPDGKKAITVHQRSLSYQWDQKVPPVSFLYDLTTGKRQRVFGEGRIHPVLVKWARDGSGVYAAAPHSSHPVFQTATITLLYFHELASGKVTQVDLAWERGLAGGLEVTDDGFLTLLANGTRLQPARYTRQGGGWSKALIEGEHATNLFDLALGPDGRTLVYEHSTASKPEQWFRAMLEAARIVSPVQFTDLNAGLKSRTFAKTEVIRWKGALDEEVEGILYYPHGYVEGRRYPLVLAIHGGPAGADLDSWDDRWSYPTNLIAQRGAFVLKPNYHGSGNYGLKWVESICCGKYYELEVPDMEKGVDHLIAQGKVDPERIGTMGWSNGSILSIQLLVMNPDRYKAATVGAGDVEWISDWANVDFGHAFDAYYFGRSPLEDPELYIRKSPFFKMDRVKTPTLIFFGTEDRNVPTDQGWTHYRALQHLDKVPVRFVLFPGEPHGLRKLTHQIRKVEEELRWFDRHLFKSEPAATEALKDDSPLAVALKKKTAKAVGGRYGVLQSGALIPEVVRRGGLEVGRFEVTRAQFAAFDRSYRYEPGTDNHPANSVAFEKAKAYAAWLSTLTGQSYRIPKEDEVASFYEPRPVENTLDYWAGYAANPEDAARLAELVQKLGGKSPLLKEVGSFAPAGEDWEEPVFDLGGNVAEWVVATDGSGKALGGRASRSSDARAVERSEDPAYVGLRVVRGAPPG